MITTEDNKWTEAYSQLFFMPKYMNIYTGTVTTIFSWRGHREEKFALRILIKTDGIFGLKLQNSTAK